MDSPFAFVGSSSLKGNFIGRDTIIDKIINKIKERCEMISIVGLPRMGKTSLMWHMFLEEGKLEWWFSNHRIIPIYTDIGKQPYAKNLWGAIATNLSFALIKIEGSNNATNTSNLDSVKEDLNVISKTEDAADRHNLLEKCLHELQDFFNIKVLIIFDELDYLWKYKYTQDQFNQLRSMSLYCHVITCSRRKPCHIEKMAFNSNYFDNKTYKYIWISPFSPDEVAEYWQHFEPSFNELKKEDFVKYQELVKLYTGSHPHMMNIMNNEAFESGNIIEWHKTLKSTDRNEAERKFRLSLKDAFKKQMVYIKEQELDESAIKLVLEGVELPPKEDIDDLLDYGFVKQVPTKVKYDIFGYNMGPTTNKGEERFICMSGFFSHLLKEEYEPTIKGLQLLRTTEKKMQRFVKELLKKEYGSDCLDSDAEENSPDYKEKWENYFEPKRDEWVEEQMTIEELKLHKNEINKWKKAILCWEQRRDSRFKRISNGCKPPSERQPIDTLSSFDIGNFIYTFFDKKHPWSTDALKFAKKWDSDFRKWGIWRNAEQHFYVEEKTEEFINKAEESCHRICRDIDDWISKNQISREL